MAIGLQTDLMDLATTYLCHLSTDLTKSCKSPRLKKASFMDIHKTRLETTRKNKRKENNHTCLILAHYLSMISELNDTRLFNPNVMLCVRNTK